MSAPQQSLLLVHASPVPRQPHVPLLGLQTLGAQQSPSVAHVAPAPRQPHVAVFGSHRRAPQQSASLVQPAPLDAHPQVPSTHRPEQHSLGEAQTTPSFEQLPPPLPLPPSSPVAASTHVLLVGSQR
jgi:hypothetical protein